MIRATLLAMFCLATLALAGHDYLGERPPEIRVGGWVNLEPGAERPTLENLRGKVVVLDFWHTTCSRCLAKIGRLRELHEDYADQGLVVMALSAQNSATIADQTPKQNIPYLTAHDDRSEFGVDGEDGHDPNWHRDDNPGCPETYLLAMDGTVVWQGRTVSGLVDDLVEEELARIEPMPPLGFSDAFGKILRDVERNRLGKAWEASQKLIEKDKDPDDTANAQRLCEWIETRAARHKELADKAVAAERYLRATEILGEIADIFSEMPIEEECDDQLKAWKKDKEIKKLIEAEKYLQMGKELRRERRIDDAMQAFAAVIKKAPDSELAAEAEALIIELQQR